MYKKYVYLQTFIELYVNINIEYIFHNTVKPL